MLKKIVLVILLLIIASVLIGLFVISPVQIKGSDMEPAVKSNQICLENKLSYVFGSPQENDIVVYRYEGFENIKRIISLPDGSRDSYVLEGDNKLKNKPDFVSRKDFVGKIVFCF